MDETSPPPPPPQQPQPQLPSDPMPPQHWCYHCDRRVSVETLADHPDVICSHCKFGFVESLPSPPPPPPPESSPPPLFASSPSDEPTLGSRFLQVLRLLAQVANEEGVPPPPSLTPPSDDNSFLRIELDAFQNDNETETFEDDDDEDEDEHSVEIEEEDDEDEDEDRSERQIDNNREAETEEEVIRRRRRDVLRLRLRDFASRSSRSEGRNRVLDWAEIFMGLEDNSVEFRFEMPETDRYIGDPADYVDAAEYEALLQNLAETEGRRGAPPASRAAIAALKSVVIGSEEETYDCAVCKDLIGVGVVVKELPCGHGYHGECIVPWLGARNSCPVCRFELATDDVEYEEDRRKREGSGSAEAEEASASTGRNDN